MTAIDSGVTVPAEGSASTNKQTGIVKWFSFSRGYGFITQTQSGQEYFVHQSNIIMDGFRSLRLGEAVEFNVEEADGRIKAIDVTGPGGAPPQGAPPRAPRSANGDEANQPSDQADPASTRKPGRGRGRGGRSGRSRGRGRRGAATGPQDSSQGALHPSATIPSLSGDVVAAAASSE